MNVNPVDFFTTWLTILAALYIFYGISNIVFRVNLSSAIKRFIICKLLEEDEVLASKYVKVILPEGKSTIWKIVYTVKKDNKKEDKIKNVDEKEILAFYNK